MKTLLLHPCSSSTLPWRPMFPNYSSRFRFRFFSTATRYRSWDSNAESFSSHNFRRRDEDPNSQDEEDDHQGFDPGIRFGTSRNKRRRWWSDDPAPEEFEDEPSGILNQVIDSVWILKVFKSYGWTLPPIIFSLLLNSGPKAFLMALALPLGQSLISLALEKLWGEPERKTKRRTRNRTRKRPFYSKEEEEEAKGNGYQSWEVGKNGGEVRKEEGKSGGTSFGGWEDLDGGDGTVRKAKSGVRAKKQSSSSSMESGKLSWREKKSDTPLLLRLLIAVFPFLGSWTRML